MCGKDYLTASRIIILLLVFPIVTLCLAQSDLPLDEQELLARYIEIISQEDLYGSFVATYTEMDLLYFIATTDDNVHEFSIQSRNEGIEIVNYGDNPNGQNIVTVTYDEINGDEIIHYVMDVEMRYVDGVLYVLAKYIEATGDVAELPVGWVVADDPYDYPNGETIKLHYFLDYFEDGVLPADEEITLAEDIKIANATVRSVTMEQDEIDGIPMDIITFTYNDSLAKALLRQEAAEDEILNAFVNNIDNSDSFITIAVDADNIIHSRVDHLDLGAVMLDSSLLPALPYNMTVEAGVSIIATNVYSNVNEELEPITAPEY